MSSSVILRNCCCELSMGFPRDTSSEVPLDGCRDRASLEQGEIISGEGFLFTQMWVKEDKPLPVKRSSTVSVLHCTTLTVSTSLSSSSSTSGQERGRVYLLGCCIELDIDVERVRRYVRKTSIEKMLALLEDELRERDEEQ